MHRACVDVVATERNIDVNLLAHPRTRLGTV